VNTRSMTRVGIMAGVTAVLAWVAVPLPFSPVPLTGQTIGVMLSGLLLAPREAAASQTVYLLCGALGLPVFSGGRSGLGILMGPTGGYLLGFIPGALVCSAITGSAQRGAGRESLSPLYAAVLGVVVGGVVVVDLLGVVRLAQVAQISIGKALAVGVVPYLVGDAIKCIVTVAAWAKLRHLRQ
jgi:biotin transport system substrate-specific component